MNQHGTGEGAECEPGHKPMILPSSLPSLYLERQFALYMDYAT